MYNVRRYEVPLGANQRLLATGYLSLGRSTSYEEAVGKVREYVAKFDRSGKNHEQDWWWCRNNGDARNTVLIIEA